MSCCIFYLTNLLCLLKGVVTEAVVGVGQYAVVTAGGSGAGVAEVRRFDFASSGSSSCEVVA